MNLSDLKPARGAKKERKRRGRGPASGQGKTAGRGSKGQLQGAGFSRKPGFEGGQMPLVRRIPKRGFTNIFRVEYTAVNLDRLNALAAEAVGPAELAAAGVIQRADERIKILGRGDLAAAKTVSAHKFSRSAAQKIAEKGGRAVVIG